MLKEVLKLIFRGHYNLNPIQKILKIMMNYISDMEIKDIPKY